MLFWKDKGGGPNCFDPATPLRDWGDSAFTIADAVAGVCVTGGTGSGKTSGPGKHLAYAYLAAGFGGVVLCAKPEELQQWVRWARDCRRTQDLIVVNPRAEARFNFLDWEAARSGEGGGLTINIVSMLDEIASAIKGSEGVASGGDSKFFDDALHHMNTNLVDLAQFSGLRLTLPLLRDMLLSAPQTLEEAQSQTWQEGSICHAVLQEANARVQQRGDRHESADFAECRAYFLTELPTLSFKTRSIIQLMFSMLTRPFTTRPLRRLFCEETTVTPEATFDGKIILVDLPVQEYRLAGRVAAIVWKYCFQTAVMRRPPPEQVPGRPRAYPRPVFLWADEAQNFVTDRDAEYQAVARSAGGCTVYLTQNRESYRRVLGNYDTVDALLGNLQCKIMCQNSSPETNEWSARLLGERYVNIESEGMSFGMDAGNSSLSQHTSEQRRYYVEPAQFAMLKRGGKVNDLLVEAIVYKGGTRFASERGDDELVPYKRVFFTQGEEGERSQRHA